MDWLGRTLALLLVAACTPAGAASVPPVVGALPIPPPPPPPPPPPASTPEPAASPAPPRAVPTLAAVDVFGTKMTAEEVLAIAGLPPPPVPLDDAFNATLKAAKARLLATGRFAYVNPSVITYFGGEDMNRGYATIDLVDVGDEARMRFAAVPTATLPDPGGLIAAWDAYSKRFFELLETGDPKIVQQGQCKAFHCLSFDNPDLAPYDDRFAREVPPHFAELARVLHEDRDAEKRASAAFLLAYGTSAQAVVDALLPAVKDASSHVRNNAMRVFCELPEKAPDARIPLEPFLDALDFPDTTDRNKAGFALFALVKRAPDASRRVVLARGSRVLLSMLALKQPNNRQAARMIFQTLAGKDLGDDPAAWSKWVGTERRATAR